MSKLIGLGVLGGLAYLVVGSLPELKRYQKIRSM
jgi:hypothetical protein